MFVHAPGLSPLTRAALSRRRALHFQAAANTAFLQSEASPPHIIYGIYALSQELSNNQRQELEKLFPFVRDVLNTPLPKLTQEAADTQTNQVWTSLISSAGNMTSNLFTLGMLTISASSFPMKIVLQLWGLRSIEQTKLQTQSVRCKNQRKTSRNHTIAKCWGFWR